MNTHTKQSSFTLIELLIVIAIIAIIAGAILVVINPALRLGQANDSRRFSEVRSISTAVSTYIVDNKGDVPDCGANGDLPADNTYYWIGTGGVPYINDPSSVGAWLMDDTITDSVADDSSQKSNDGTCINCPTDNPAGQFGTTAYSFNSGASNYIDLGSNLNIIQNLEAVTLLAWVNPNAFANTEQYIVGLSINDIPSTLLSRALLTLSSDDNEIRAGGRSADNDSVHFVDTTSNKVQALTWQHIAAVIDYANNSINIYYNGQPEPTSPGSIVFSQNRTANTPSTNNTIGSEENGDSAYFNGSIDEVGIFNRALTSVDINNILTNGLSSEGLFCDLSSDLDQYLFTMPQDPTGADPGGSSGYLIKRDLTGTITVKAPYASQYATQEIMVSR